MMIEKKNHLQKLMDKQRKKSEMYVYTCLLYTFDAADEQPCVNTAAPPTTKKKTTKKTPDVQ